MPTQILKCICSHPFQDKKYGKGKRVHNVSSTLGNKTDQNVRCTVCGNTTSVGVTTSKKGKK